LEKLDIFFEESALITSKIFRFSTVFKRIDSATVLLKIVEDGLGLIGFLGSTLEQPRLKKQIQIKKLIFIRDF